MEDIAPKLLEKIQEDFERSYLKSKRIIELKSRLVKGVADYKDGHTFAIEVGTILSNAFCKNISSADLPDGRLYYNIADRVLRPMLEHDFDLISEYSMEMQEILNKKAKIGIKAIRPELNLDKIQGIIDITSGKKQYDDIAYMLGEPIINFSQTIVDDTVKANADFQYKSGLNPKIRRISTGKCCEWCNKLAGVYDYESVRNTGNDVFRRHRACRCLVEYEPGTGKRQNVHTKQWKKEEKSDKIKLRELIGLSPEDDSVIEEIRQKIIPEQNIKKVAERQEIHRKDTELYNIRQKNLEEKGQYGPSYITISDDEVLELVQKYSGKGIIKYDRQGKWNNQEIIVTNDKIIGVVVDNRNGNFAETPVFKIHYAKDGIHIVPDYPSKRRR